MTILVLQHRVALPIGLMRRMLQERFPISTWRVGDEDDGGADDRAPLTRPTTVLGRNASGQALSCVELHDRAHPGVAGDCPPAHQCHIAISRPTIEDDDLARAITLVIAAAFAVQEDAQAWLQLAPGENWLDARDMRALVKLLADDPALRRRGEYGIPPGATPAGAPAAAVATPLAAEAAPGALQRPVLGSFSIVFDRSPRIDWPAIAAAMNAIDPDGRWSIVATPNGLGFATGRAKIFILWGTNHDANGQGYDAAEIGQALRRSQPFDGDLAPLGGRTQRVTLRIEAPESFTDKAQAAKAATLMIGLVARSAGAVAVLNDTCGTIFTPGRVAALVAILGSDEVPIELWTWTAPDALTDGDVSLTTSGLAAFFGYEVEVWNAPLPVDTVAEKMSGVLRYLLLEGPVLGHGETIGVSADDRSIRCFFGASRANRPEPVRAMFLEFDLDPPAAPKKDLPLPPSLRPDAPRPAAPALLRRPATFGRKGL